MCGRAQSHRSYQQQQDADIGLCAAHAQDSDTVEVRHHSGLPKAFVLFNKLTSVICDMVDVGQGCVSAKYHA